MSSQTAPAFLKQPGPEPPPGAGIGLREAHVAELLASRPALAFVEVHSENYFVAGGAARARLLRAREHWPVSLHGVGLSLGSAGGLDLQHLEQLAQLVQQLQPCLVSDHASFSRGLLHTGAGVAAVHAQDLLPVAFTTAALNILAAQVQQVQDRLQRPLLVENISAYLRWADPEMAETEFLNALTQRTGCGLLLDVNNLVVNALNDQGAAARDLQAAVRAACAWVDSIRASAVGEVHLAGFHDAGDIVIDDHGSTVPDSTWAVYRHSLQRLGRRPTLVEWDTRLPPLHTLLGEARCADALLAQAGLQGDAWPGVVAGAAGNTIESRSG